ncbi:MAG: hypothetical protein AAB578_08610, partial [Elusimicrobiota bacterium]
MRRRSRPASRAFLAYIIVFAVLVLSPIQDILAADSKSQRPAKTEAKQTMAGDSLAKQLFRLKVEQSALVLKALEQKAQRARQGVPPASSMLERFNARLMTKPPKHDGVNGGLFWRLSAVHWSLGQAVEKAKAPALAASAGGLPLIESGLAGEADLAKTAGKAHQIRSDALKLAQEVQASFGPASKTLWGRDEKQSAIVLDAFRKEAVEGLNKSAKYLADGLKVQDFSLRGSLLAAALAAQSGCSESEEEYLKLLIDLKRNAIKFYQGQIDENKNDPVCNWGPVVRKSCDDAIELNTRLKAEAVQELAKLEGELKACREKAAPKPPPAPAPPKPAPPKPAPPKPAPKPPVKPPAKPAAPKEACPKGNPACAGLAGRKIKPRVLTPAEQKVVNQALVNLTKTATGGELLKPALASPPSAKTLTIDSLNKVNVSVIGSEGPLPDNAAAVTVPDDKNKGFVI